MTRLQISPYVAVGLVLAASNYGCQAATGDKTLFRQMSEAVQADESSALHRSSATYVLPGRSLMGGVGENAFTYKIPLATPGKQNRAALLEQFPAPNVTSSEPSPPVCATPPKSECGRVQIDTKRRASAGRRLKKHLGAT